MKPTRRSSQGFTLLEVLVALIVAGTVALLAHQLFSVAVGASAGLGTRRASLDRTANASRFLAAAFLSLDVGEKGAIGFEGRQDEMRFATWLQTADGWFELQPLSLSLKSQKLTARVAGGGALMLSDSVASIGFDYLLTPGEEARWVREWVSPVSAPLAVRLRVTRHLGTRVVSDTAIYLIKGRG